MGRRMPRNARCGVLFCCLYLNVGGRLKRVCNKILLPEYFILFLCLFLSKFEVQ